MLLSSAAAAGWAGTWSSGMPILLMHIRKVHASAGQQSTQCIQIWSQFWIATLQMQPMHFVYHMQDFISFDLADVAAIVDWVA